MRQLTIFMIVMAVTMLFSCGNKTKMNEWENDTLSKRDRSNGDSTLYGLACDGCTDSVLIFLSFEGGDPITFDIIEASKKKKIIGRPATGDWVGVIVNGKDKKKADMVIDLDQLKGSWVYQAMPQRRENKKKELNIYVDQAEEDSIIQSLMVPMEQGFALKRNSVASPIGMLFSNDETSPVVYPKVKMYSDWGIYNGKLLLIAKSMKKSKRKQDKTEVDTAEFIFMMKDSLRLKFNDGIKAYYRK
ncbi:MAG: hypothetical protein ACI4V5_08895 [Prevotella sp.]